MSERFSAVPDARPHDAPWPAMSWPPRADTRLAGQIVEVSPFDAHRDAELLFRALDHDSVWAHLPGRPKDPAALVASFAADQAEGRFLWVVRLARDYVGLPKGAVVGTTSYLDPSARDARVEIGATAYAPPVWASRVNPETKLLLLSHAFDVLGAGRVQLKTDARNVRSQEAIARLGARYEGTLRRHMRRPDGTVRDTVMFSIIAEEWPAVREALRVRLTA